MGLSRRAMYDLLFDGGSFWAAELDHVNNDLQNLNASTQIATISLDAGLHIKSFTPPVGAVIRLAR